MSSDEQDNPPKGSSDAGPGSNRARQLFGHKGGASPWEKVDRSKRSDERGQTVPSADAATAASGVNPASSSAPYPRDAQYTPRPAFEEAQPQLAPETAPSVLGEVDDEGELTKLHPNYKLVMRLGAVFAALVIVVISIIAEAALRENLGVPTGIVMIPAVLFALFLAIRIPVARYNARGYQISRDRLRVVRGVFWHSDTVVPFGRVQHIDVDQGPVERALDIATLTLHTAGTHNASVSLPGLGHPLAVQMREEIRAHIKRETM